MTRPGLLALRDRDAGYHAVLPVDLTFVQQHCVQHPITGRPGFPRQFAIGRLRYRERKPGKRYHPVFQPVTGAWFRRCCFPESAVTVCCYAMLPP